MTSYLRDRAATFTHALSLESLNRELGKILLVDFRRHHLHRYVQRRVKQVARNTVNRDVAALRKMFSFALELGVIDYHPLVRFPMLKVQEVPRRILTVEEFHLLVQSMDRLEIAALVAVMGETGIRKSEALFLEWDSISVPERILSVGRTKNQRVRHIPLSEFALDWLQRLVRHLHCPYVFVSSQTNQRWVNPEKAFKRGAVRAGLNWVGFHYLRRFRATHWLRLGVDVRTVKDLLGHRDILTTMRYALFVSDHAVRSVRDAQRLEEGELTTAERVRSG